MGFENPLFEYMKVVNNIDVATIFPYCLLSDSVKIYDDVFEYDRSDIYYEQYITINKTINKTVGKTL